VVDLLPVLIAGGDIGEEVEDVSRSHTVFEEAAAISLPFALEIPGGDGDLV